MQSTHDDQYLRPGEIRRSHTSKSFKRATGFSGFATSSSLDALFKPLFTRTPRPRAYSGKLEPFSPPSKALEILCLKVCGARAPGCRAMALFDASPARLVEEPEERTEEKELERDLVKALAVLILRTYKTTRKRKNVKSVTRS